MGTKEQVIEEIQKMEEEDFSEFYELISEKMNELSGNDGEDSGIVGPDSAISARNWVFAYIKLKEKNEFFKEEYIPALTEKYIAPVRLRITKNEEAQDFIKSGLLDFLKASEQKNITFPDLATVCEAKTQPKLVYPEDLDAFLQKLIEEKSEFVVNKPSLDKKAMLDQFKKTGEVPHQDLIGEGEGTSIRITVAKSRKQG
jgi:hypothetical protein